MQNTNQLQRGKSNEFKVEKLGDRIARWWGFVSAVMRQIDILSFLIWCAKKCTLSLCGIPDKKALLSLIRRNYTQTCVVILQNISPKLFKAIKDKMTGKDEGTGEMWQLNPTCVPWWHSGKWHCCESCHLNEIFGLECSVVTNLLLEFGTCHLC